MGTFTALSLFVALAVSATLPQAQAQFVPPPTDLISKAGAAGVGVRYKQLPTGTCETRANVTHLSGFADVSPDLHVYFQFFETRKGDPKKAPLTVWINGGTGTTSMIGLYTEIGSCSIDANLKPVDNPFAWSEVTNMLFLDQPNTVGNSYTQPVPGYISIDTDNQFSLPSEVCPDYAERSGLCGTYSRLNSSSAATFVNGKVTSGTDQTAQNHYLALQGFVGAFPEYATSGVSIATDSYGATQVSALAKLAVEKKREAASGQTPIDLRALTVAGGWYDLEAAYSSLLSYMKKNPYGLTYPNASVVAEIENALTGKGNCVDQLKECYKTDDPLVCNQAVESCDNGVKYPFDTYTKRHSLDVRQLEPSPFPYFYYYRYLNLPANQKAFGLFRNFTTTTTSSDRAFRYSANAPKEGRQAVDTFRFLLDAGVHVALTAGDADYLFNIDHSDATSKSIGAKGFNEAGWVNLTTSDGIVHGQTKQSGGFSYTQFYLSGHQISLFQPLASLEFIERVINHKDVATGKQDVAPGSAYKTVGPVDNFVVQGKETVANEVLPDGSTYDTKTGKGVPPPKDAKDAKSTNKNK